MLFTAYTEEDKVKNNVQINRKKFESLAFL